MKPRSFVCSVMIGALAAGANALAQSNGDPLGVYGVGFAVPETATSTLPRPMAGLRLDTAETWWGFPVTGRHVQVGMSLAPRLGTGFPFPARAYLERIHDPIELGPGLRWRSTAGTLSASYRFDPMGNSQGESLHVSFSRPIISNQGFRLLAYVGAEWQSGRTVQVAPGLTELGSTRPIYSSGSAANIGFGLDTHYQVTRSSAIVVGARGLRFGGAPVEGALYADRWQATLYGGYSFRF
jgi:hypothetical protein